MRAKQRDREAYRERNSNLKKVEMQIKGEEEQEKKDREIYLDEEKDTDINTCNQGNKQTETSLWRDRLTD